MDTTTTTVKRTAFFNFGFAGSARTLKPSPLLLSKFENNRTLLEEKEEEEEEALLVDAAADDDVELIVNIFIIFALLLRVKKKLHMEFSVKFLYLKSGCMMLF